MTGILLRGRISRVCLSRSLNFFFMVPNATPNVTALPNVGGGILDVGVGRVQVGHDVDIDSHIIDRRPVFLDVAAFGEKSGNVHGWLLKGMPEIGMDDCDR